MRITIVIPAYNRGQFIAQTIESVLGQTVTDWELIVVDDGSADDTLAIARGYAARDHRVRVVSQANAGVGAARNRGLAEAGCAARYITFLDSDDLWEGDALERLLTVLEGHPQSPAASGLSRIVDTEGEPRSPGELETWGRRRQAVIGGRLVAWPCEAPTTLAVLAYCNCIYTPGQVLIRRSALTAAGRFDAGISPCDDWDMWLRLSLLGPIAFLDRVVLNWRRHGRGESMRKEEIYRGHAQIRRKLLSTPALSAEQRRTLLAANRMWGRRVCSTRLQRVRSLLRHADARAAWKEAGHLLRDWRDHLRGVPLAEPLILPTVGELHRSLQTAPAEVKQPLQLLRRLARSCQHVTELGTGAGLATTALVSAGPRVLVSYDRDHLPQIALLQAAARKTGRTRLVVHQSDLASLEVEETDLLLISAWSTQDELRRYLQRHAARTRRYLVLSTRPTAPTSGGPADHRGAEVVVAEFLRHDSDWQLDPRGADTHGLVVLTRPRPATPAAPSPPACDNRAAAGVKSGDRGCPPSGRSSQQRTRPQAQP